MAQNQSMVNQSNVPLAPAPFSPINSGNQPVAQTFGDMRMNPPNPDVQQNNGVGIKQDGQTYFTDRNTALTIAERKANLAQENRLIDAANQQPITQDQILQEAGMTNNQNFQTNTAQGSGTQQSGLTTPQQISRIGLAIPVTIGNALTSVLEGITGKKFGRSSTTELSQTGAGEALGLGIVGVGLAAGGLYAYESYLGSLSAQQLIDITAERSLASTIRMPALNQLTKITESKILLGAGTLTVPRILRKDAKNAVIGQRQLIADTLDDVKNNRISYSDAVMNLKEIDGNINRLNGSMKKWQSLSLDYWLGGGKDDAVDVQSTRNQLRQAETDLPNIAIQAATTRLTKQ